MAVIYLALLYAIQVDPGGRSIASRLLEERRAAGTRAEEPPPLVKEIPDRWCGWGWRSELNTGVVFWRATNGSLAFVQAWRLAMLAKRETLTAFFSTTMPTFLQKMERVCTGDGGGPLVGSKLSLADVALFVLITDYFDNKEGAKEALRALTLRRFPSLGLLGERDGTDWAALYRRHDRFAGRASRSRAMPSAPLPALTVSSTTPLALAAAGLLRGAERLRAEEARAAGAGRRPVGDPSSTDRRRILDRSLTNRRPIVSRSLTDRRPIVD